jgi:hypothetical protein
MHELAASSALHDGVPEVVRSHFATAQNLLAYSWFHYPFNVTAQFLAYVSVEAALKHRYPNLKSHRRPKEPAGFKELVAHAVCQGDVSDTGFAHVRWQIEDRERELAAGLPWSAALSTEHIRPYVAVLIETLPGLRNSFAHGEYMLHNQGAGSVRICAEFINQLFVVPQ